MGRKLLADSELRGANLSVRVPAGLNEALDRAVAGRACTKSDLVIAALEAAVASDSTAALVAQVEAARVRTLSALDRDSVVRQLQVAEDRRVLLRLALDAMDAKPASPGLATATSDHKDCNAP